MMDLVQLDWRNPWWGLLALQPLLMAGWLSWRRQKVAHYADPHLQPWALRGRLGAAPVGWRNTLNVLAWVLLACAAAEPRLPLLTVSQQHAATLRHDLDLMLVLDVSTSMQAQDIAPQRLLCAKLKLLDLLPRLHGERVGLIVFSGNAGLLMPLTQDMRVVPHYLDLAQPMLFDLPGTNLAAALNLARQTLLAQPGRRGAVLLLSDGDVAVLSGQAGAAALAATRQLSQTNLPLYVLGVGSTAGTSIPLPGGGVLEHDGAPVSSALDVAGYTTLARLGGGRYASVTDGNNDLAALYDHGIARLPGNPLVPDATQAWRELYAWFLLPAWLLFLLAWLPLTPRVLQAGLLAALLGGSLPPQPAHASESDPAAAAYLAYRIGHYVEAQALYAQVTGYPGAMGSGAAAYRRRDYSEAIRQFTQAALTARATSPRADALYNLGNSFFAAGNLRAAADAYRGVLELRPRDSNAAANLALAAGQMNQPRQPPRSTGVPGRRGTQLGDAQTSGDQPVGMVPDKPKSGVEVDLSATQRGLQDTRLRSQMTTGSGRAAVSEAAYQAALKKLEFSTDQAAKIEHQMMQQDSRATSPVELLPW